MMIKRSVGSWVVIVAFGFSGVAHLVNPAAFLGLMPPFLPWPLALVYTSGVAEIFAAVLLLLRHRLGPLVTVVVLLAVWPANWWFAIDVMGQEPWWAVLIAWLRLPLQIPLLWWAWRSPVTVRD
jgi:uncharacterized membrane protein